MLYRAAIKSTPQVQKHTNKQGICRRIAMAARGARGHRRGRRHGMRLAGLCCAVVCALGGGVLWPRANAAAARGEQAEEVWEKAARVKKCFLAGETGGGMEEDALPMGAPVSVVVAVRGRRETFREALYSWLMRPQIGEVVVVDWGSDRGGQKGLRHVGAGTVWRDVRDVVGRWRDRETETLRTMGMHGSDNGNSSGGSSLLPFRDRPGAKVRLVTLPLEDVVEDPKRQRVGAEVPVFKMGPAFNLALSLARGDVILKLDADSRLEDGFFTMPAHRDLLDKVRQRREHRGDKRMQAEAVLFHGDWEDMSGVRPDLSPLEFKVNHLNGAFMAPRELVHAVGGYDERMCSYGWEDENFYRRMAATKAYVDGTPVKVVRTVFAGGISHIEHPRGNSTGFDERVTMFINDLSERRFKGWGRHLSLGGYSLQPVQPNTPGARADVLSPRTCVARRTHPVDCFQYMYQSDQRWRDLLHQARAHSFVVTCRRCIRIPDAMSIPDHVQDAMLNFFVGRKNDYRYAVGILRGQSSTEQWDRKVLCQTVALAMRLDLHIAVILDTTHDLGFPGDIRSYSKVLPADGADPMLDRKFLLVGQLFMQTLSPRFFVEADTKATKDKRHLLVGRLQRGAVANQLVARHILHDDGVQSRCHALYKELEPLANWVVTSLPDGSSSSPNSPPHAANDILQSRLPLRR